MRGYGQCGGMRRADRGTGGVDSIRQVLLAHSVPDAVAASDTVVLVAMAVVFAGMSGLLVHVLRRGSRIPVLLLVVLLVGVSAFAGMWKVRGAVRDAQHDQSEAVTQVLETQRRTVAPGPPSGADVWAVGDGADGKPMSQAVIALMAATDPVAILQLGDVYGPYAAYMDSAYGPLAERVLATPGNHDWHRPKRIADYLSYWETRPQGRALYYSYQVAGWQVLSLNSEIPQETDAAQTQWLKAQVQAPGDCRIAFFHRPRFSAGRHGDQSDMADLWHVLAGRTTLVLNGHDHDMQRLGPIDGITEMVVGSGGHGHYALHADPRVAFGDDVHDGALHLSLKPGSAHYAFTAVDGTVLDSGDLTCSSAG
jgi:hypothetical protein